MVRMALAVGISLVAHGVVIVAALTGVPPAGTATARDPTTLRVVDASASAAAGLKPGETTGGEIAAEVEVLARLPAADRLRLLEERAERARRVVRNASVGEIATFLDIPAAPPLEAAESAPRELDPASMTVLEIERAENGGYRVRAADAQGRWAWIDVEDPEDPEAWAAAEQALRLVRSHPTLEAIYVRCVSGLLPRIAQALARDHSPPSGRPAP